MHNLCKLLVFWFDFFLQIYQCCLLFYYTTSITHNCSVVWILTSWTMLENFVSHLPVFLILRLVHTHNKVLFKPAGWAYHRGHWKLLGFRFSSLSGSLEKVVLWLKSSDCVWYLLYLIFAHISLGSFGKKNLWKQGAKDQQQVR